MTAYLGKLCERIPYAGTADYFNRDASSVAKDVLRFDLTFRSSMALRQQVDVLARSLIRTCF